MAALRFVSTDSIMNARNRHLETKYFYVSYYVNKYEIKPVYVNTADNLSDGVSKILKPAMQKYFWTDLCNMATAPRATTPSSVPAPPPRGVATRT
jgi:hypothetical protein